MQKYYDDERVAYISSEKENKKDGVEKTFYVKFPWIGDANNDGEIDESDLYVYSINNDGVRTVYTVTSLDNSRIGKFTLSAAPTSNETLYVTYPSAPVDMASNTIVKMACIYLTGALASTHLDAGQLRTFRVGKIYVSKDMSPYTDYKTKYDKLVLQIKAGKDIASGKTDDPLSSIFFR